MFSDTAKVIFTGYFVSKHSFSIKEILATICFGHPSSYKPQSISSFYARHCISERYPKSSDFISSRYIMTFSWTAILYYT